MYFSFLFSSLWDAANVYGNSIEGDMLTTGTPLSSPPLIDMISSDPILSGVKVFTHFLLYSPLGTKASSFIPFFYKSIMIDVNH